MGNLLSRCHCKQSIQYLTEQFEVLLNLSLQCHPGGDWHPEKGTSQGIFAIAKSLKQIPFDDSKIITWRYYFIKFQSTYHFPHICSAKIYHTLTRQKTPPRQVSTVGCRLDMLKPGSKDGPNGGVGSKFQRLPFLAQSRLKGFFIGNTKKP